MSVNPLRHLPSVNELLAAGPLSAWHQQLPRKIIVTAAREVLEDTRQALRHASSDTDPSTVDNLAELVADRLRADRQSTQLVEHP